MRLLGTYGLIPLIIWAIGEVYLSGKVKQKDGRVKICSCKSKQLVKMTKLGKTASKTGLARINCVIFWKNYRATKFMSNFLAMNIF